MTRSRFQLIFPAALLLLVVTGCFSSSGILKRVKFERPDIKNDFCGVHINFQYCKCAFHGDFCDSIGLPRKEANNKVQSEYTKWLEGRLQDFGTSCTSNGGIFKKEACIYCETGYAALNGECAKKTESEQQRTEFKPDGPLTSECVIKQDEYDKDWKKYSDIDKAIPFEERSFEAKQALTIYESMVAKMIEAFALERDIEIENQMQSELAEYRTALAQNIKTNLLKSFWRLAWVTYSTIKTGRGLGESYSTLLTEGASIETLGAGLKVVQGMIPNDSVLAIDTDSITGKVKSVGASVALEAIDSLGDPTKIATELFNSAANAALPSADLKQEEIDILETQHITKGVVDEILAESRAINVERQAKLSQLEQEIIDLQGQIPEWENKEKNRVATELEESCKTLKKQAEQSA